MRANNSTKYIKSTKKEFGNFYEEVLELYNKINSSTLGIEDLKKEIEEFNNKINENNSNKDLEHIKNQIKDIINRINNIYTNTFDKDMELLTTTREYFYNSNNDIVKEVVSGDLEYTYEYLYDNKNISEVNIYDKKNNKIGFTRYIYDDLNNIKKIVSTNAEILSIATSSSRIKDLDNKFNNLISEDFINKINNLDNDKILDYKNEINSLYLKLEILEKGLPTSEEMLKVPVILDRLSELEKIINKLNIDINYNTHCFNVSSNIYIYKIPENIDLKKSEVLIEGLKLDYGCEYIEHDNSSIEFLVPLIDGYKVLIEYTT